MLSDPFVPLFPASHLPSEQANGRLEGLMLMPNLLQAL